MDVTIVVVDDERANQIILKNILKTYKTVCVSSAQELFDLIASESVDLILLDIMMPNMTGLEAAEKINAFEIPFIFITAKSTGDDVETGFCKGAMDYIKKPFEAAEVRARVSYALEKIEAQKKLEEETTVDPLTQAKNRRFMRETLNQLIIEFQEKKHYFSLILFDLDDFKQVNDTYGHIVGDQVLQTVSKTVQKHLKNGAELCRYGGEEFVIILPCTGQLKAYCVAEIIRQDIEKSVREVLKIDQTVSLGVATYETDKTREAIVEEADKNLYRAKKNGKNQTVMG